MVETAAEKVKRFDAEARGRAAGRVLDPYVFPLILAALAKYDANKNDPTAEDDFKAACGIVIDDKDLIDDMWKATKATRNPTVKPCW